MSKDSGQLCLKWGFPKIKGTFLGVPIIRTIVYWGLYWGPLILGSYQVEAVVKAASVHRSPSPPSFFSFAVLPLKCAGFSMKEHPNIDPSTIVVVIWTPPKRDP